MWECITFTMTEHILSVFSELANCIRATNKGKKVSIYLKGGALFKFISGEDLDDTDDLDLLLICPEQVTTDWINVCEPYLQLLKVSGNFKEVKIEDNGSDGWYPANTYLRRFIVGTRQVDIMFYDPQPDIIANVVRGEIKNGTINSIKASDNSMLMDGMSDIYNKKIHLHKSAIENTNTRYRTWLRIYKYLSKGWTIDPEDENTRQCLPHWLSERIVLPEHIKNNKDEVCPLTHEPLANLEWIAKTPCEHYFEAGALLEYYFSKIAKLHVPCPMCRSNIFIDI